MDARVAKGREIARTLKLKQRDGAWLVPSQSGNGKGYVVTHDGEHYRCDCPDFEHRRSRPSTGYCKHVYAVCVTVIQTEETTKTQETAPDGTTTVTETTKRTETVTVQATKRPTYPQDWPAYNAAQTSEKATFQARLHDLCAGVPQPEQTGANSGRKRLPLSDMIFAAAFKVYSTFSGRRFMTDLKEAHARGYLSKAPHFNSISNYLESPELTPLLKELVTTSALPLAAIEQDFAVDSSGFSTCRYTRWYDTKHGDVPMERHSWMKVHLMCGVKTNVVTAVEVTDGNGADSPRFAPLVSAASEHFTLRQVSGDLAYSSKLNVAHVSTLGAAPYIPFKSNATGGGGPMTIWRRLFHYYSLERDAFLAQYHKRSNVETTFHMIKSKFGEALRSKTQVAQFNEALLKVLCHNVCCVIQSIHELGIAPTFWGAQTA
ncbi:MAG: transposase [Chloroflexota bacterium]|nr:transposase [Chloroflexota bacterium]